MMEDSDRSGATNNLHKDVHTPPPQTTVPPTSLVATEATSSTTEANGTPNASITLGDQVLDLREQSFKLLSDYSILRGEFLTNADEPNDPNTKEFENASLTDNYLAQIKFQDKLERLYRKVVGATISADGSSQGSASYGKKFAEMKEAFEKDLAKMKVLRCSLEEANKGNKVIYKYKPGVRYQLIGEEDAAAKLRLKRAAGRKKRSSKVAEDEDEVSEHGSKSLPASGLSSLV